jgi:hypothetical protein
MALLEELYCDCTFENNLWPSHSPNLYFADLFSIGQIEEEYP